MLPSFLWPASSSASWHFNSSYLLILQFLSLSPVPLYSQLIMMYWSHIPPQLLQDFNKRFPGREHFFYTSATNYAERLLEVARQRQKDSSLKAVASEITKLLNNVGDAGFGVDAQATLSILALPYLMNFVNSKRFSRKRKVNKNIPKPSRTEINDSFITHISSDGDIRDIISKRTISYRQMGLTLQPFVIVIGESLLNPKKVLVSVDDVLYSVNTLITGVDVLFKLFIIIV
uniref:Uncharacterized protein n=1 Tax=Cacopsylla melanoneura TaxID=428564 RepID=A0A8D8PTB6_9HEMI